MHFPGLNRRRSRTAFLALAQLVLIAYVFQMAAFDHWHVDPGHDVIGVAESAAHEAHCHGNAAGCADAGAGFVTMTRDSVDRLPLPPQPVVFDAFDPTTTPDSAYVPTPTEPPRAA